MITITPDALLLSHSPRRATVGTDLEFVLNCNVPRTILIFTDFIIIVLSSVDG